MDWMRKLGLLVVMVGWAAGEAMADEAGKLVIAHVTVVDPRGGEVKAEQTVVIEGGRILRVVAAKEYRAKTGERVVDGTGKYLIPGLWDMHVHLAGVSADPAWSRDVFLPLLVAEGVTGVRDMGGDLAALQAWRLEIESGKRLGPHIVAGGPMIVPRGKKTAEQWPVADAEEARAAVRELKKQGADFIKIIEVPSREAFFEIAEEAKKEHLPFVGHVPTVVTAGEASDAGMRSIEHIVYSNLALDCSGKEVELRAALMEARKNRDEGATGRILTEAVRTYSEEKAAALWAKFKKNGTWVTPTLVAIAAQTPRAMTAEEQAKDARLEFVPAALRKEWDPRDAKNQVPDADQKWWVEQFANDMRVTREMHKAGVSLLAGSDALDRFVFPGFALHEELELLTEQGLTPMEALRAATSDAARFLGREGEFGTLAAGARADLVLLEANPVEKISNTGKIAGVVRAGVYLDRAALDGLLHGARAAAQAAK